MLLKVLDEENDINLITIKNIVSINKGSENTTFIHLISGSYIEINKSIDGFAQKYFYFFNILINFK